MPGMAEASAAVRVRRFTVLASVAGLVMWAALTGAEPRGVVVGAPAVAAAVLVARATHGWRYMPRGLRVPAFAIWFVGEIFVSAWAVARRLLARDPDLAPRIVAFPLRLRGEGARAAFMNAVTLTPGTLSAGLGADTLTVHSLGLDDSVARSLADLEARVARLYGERIAEDPA